MPKFYDSTQDCDLINEPRGEGGNHQGNLADGEAYNLFFEQPRFLFDFGIREIVMYNKLDEQIAFRHAAWILAGAPEELKTRQG